jgi:hypothetical protein
MAFLELWDGSAVPTSTNGRPDLIQPPLKKPFFSRLVGQGECALIGDAGRCELAQPELHIGACCMG